MADKVKTIIQQQDKSSVNEAMAEVEEKAKAFTEAHKGEDSEKILAEMRGEMPVSENYENALNSVAITFLQEQQIVPNFYADIIMKAVKRGANWQKQQVIKDAVNAKVTMDKPWIKPEVKLPKHNELVFCALFDVQSKVFQYYIGWYNRKEKEWFLADYGHRSDVSFWMPIPKLKVSDL